jgi:hypothetical protein
MTYHKKCPSCGGQLHLNGNPEVATDCSFIVANLKCAGCEKQFELYFTDRGEGLAEIEEEKKSDEEWESAEET